MKKLSLVLIIAITLVSCHRNDPVASAFTKYSRHDGVTSITVPGFVISLASKLAPPEDKELLEGISKVKILTIDQPEMNRKVNFHEEFHARLNTGKYEELMRISDKGTEVTIMGIMDTDHTLREMVILVGGDENALIFLKGNIRPEVIGRMAAGGVGKQGIFSGLSAL
ncbi:MAG: DUF4252 domain-containing protein [Bacteroidota bacterium]